MVNTEFSTVRFRGDKEKADNVYKGFEPLVGQDIGKCVILLIVELIFSSTPIAELVTFTASRPPHVNICDMLGTIDIHVTRIKHCILTMSIYT